MCSPINITGIGHTEFDPLFKSTCSWTQECSEAEAHYSYSFRIYFTEIIQCIVDYRSYNIFKIRSEWDSLNSQNSTLPRAIKAKTMYPSV